MGSQHADVPSDSNSTRIARFALHRPLEAFWLCSRSCKRSPRLLNSERLFWPLTHYILIAAMIVRLDQSRDVRGRSMLRLDHTGSERADNARQSPATTSDVLQSRLAMLT